MSIEVLGTAGLTTVQDLGRYGYAALGVGRAGAFDRAALRLANRLVGNVEGAAGIEVTFGGLALRLHRAVTVALTGAPCPGLDSGRAHTLAAGTVLRLGTPPTGARSYLAVRGGVAVPPVLGSASWDSLGELGPEPLRVGRRLGIGTAVAGPVAGAISAGHHVPTATPLRVIAGPRQDWFTPDALAQLTSATWLVRGDSDRIGIRLAGPALRRARTGELPSEAALPGGLQVPGDGAPILLGPDAPVTGGYPVIAVVVDADFDRAAQLRPGDAVRFRAVPR